MFVHVSGTSQDMPRFYKYSRAHASFYHITHQGSSVLEWVKCNRHWWFSLCEGLWSNRGGHSQLQRLSSNEVVMINTKQNKATKQQQTDYSLQKFWDARTECPYLLKCNPISLLLLKFRSVNPIFLKFIYFCYRICPINKHKWKNIFSKLFLGHFPAIYWDPVMYRCQHHNFVNSLPFWRATVKHVNIS